MKLTQKILDKNGVLGVIDKTKKGNFFFQFNIREWGWDFDFDPHGEKLKQKIITKKVKRYHEYKPQKLWLGEEMFLLIADGKECKL